MGRHGHLFDFVSFLLFQFPLQSVELEQKTCVLFHAVNSSYHRLNSAHLAFQKRNYLVPQHAVQIYATLLFPSFK